MEKFHELRVDCKTAGIQRFNIPVRYNNPVYLGGGAQGAVISADDAVTKNKVAIKKLLRPFKCISDAKNTYREFSLLSTIKHPNIIKMYSAFISPNGSDIYFVMEMMEKNLQDVCLKSKLTHRGISFFIYQCLCAVNHIHRHNCIHRDLKPSNIVVDKECKLKILDFGLARKTSREQMTDNVVTPYYRAPEVIFRMKYDTKIDVWSIGCILAEMVLHHPMFEGKTKLDVCESIVKIRGTPTGSMMESLESREGLEDMFRLVKSMLPVTEQPMETLFPDSLFLDEKFKFTNANFRDLIKNMLVIDPNKRYSIADALKHPYVRCWCKNEEVNVQQFPTTPYDKELNFRNTRQWEVRVMRDIRIYEQARNIFTDNFGITEDDQPS